MSKNVILTVLGNSTKNVLNHCVSTKKVLNKTIVNMIKFLILNFTNKRNTDFK